MRSLPSLTPTCTSTGFVFSSLSQSIFSLSSFVSLPLFISQFLISTYLLYLLVHYLILPFCAWCFNSLFLHSFPHNALNSVALKWRRKNKISSALSVWSTKEAETTFWLSGPWCSTVSSALSLSRALALSLSVFPSALFSFRLAPFWCSQCWETQEIDENLTFCIRFWVHVKPFVCLVVWVWLPLWLFVSVLQCVYILPQQDSKSPWFNWWFNVYTISLCMHI